MSFTILHQRALRSKCIAMSTTMDLVATLDFDGTLTVLRTFLWYSMRTEFKSTCDMLREKVFSLSSLEIGDSDPCLIEFSPCGML